MSRLIVGSVVISMLSLGLAWALVGRELRILLELLLEGDE